MINWSEANDSELVCYCIEVDKKTIVDAIKNGNDTLSKIKESTKAAIVKVIIVSRDKFANLIDKKPKPYTAKECQ
jgi:hypothetical protein